MLGGSGRGCCGCSGHVWPRKRERTGSIRAAAATAKGGQPTAPANRLPLSEVAYLFCRLSS